jgi:hypothetical protein
MHAEFRLRAASLCAAVLLCGGCASPGTSAPQAAAITGDDLLIVAVADAASVRPAAGGAARADYRQAQAYGGGGDLGQARARELAADFGLHEVKAWSIATLQWRCMLYRVARGSGRDAVLARLAADPRVALAQPLNEFQTLSTPAAAATPPYNDPYLPLQGGFAAIDAGGAQRVSLGRGVTVAVIDTAIDAKHPDLRAQDLVGRDFVGGAPQGERHGTAVAGVIAATANNGIGIAGVAPGARVLALRACWSDAAGLAGAPARCNSFTLAQALVAAMEGGADVINLSLGGPRDALLERLAERAMAGGAVIVGATPAGGRRQGFPSALAGVVAVASDDGQRAAPDVLVAPGQRVLTLAPDAGYDYAGGSSLAAAHVSGAVALLRALESRVDGAAARTLLGAGGGAIDACRALQRLRPALSAGCAAPR